jgi:hypothetical protein
MLHSASAAQVQEAPRELQLVVEAGADEEDHEVSVNLCPHPPSSDFAHSHHPSVVGYPTNMLLEGPRARCRLGSAGSDTISPASCRGEKARMRGRKITGVVIAAVGIGAGSAWAATGNSIKIGAAKHARVGQRVEVTFSGRDSSPPNVVGTFVAAVLEPPLNKGGSPCRADLGSTEQNHPASKELFFQKLLDTHHNGHYRVRMSMPAFTTAGRWTVCAWQFNNDGVTNTSKPASDSQAHIQVTRKP